MTPPVPRGTWQALLRLAVVVAVILAVNFTVSMVVDGVAPALEPAMRRAVDAGLRVWVAVAYGALLAVPFVPGVEIGLALLALFGAQVALLVWAATLGGLTLAYMAGRIMPVAVLSGLLRGLGATTLAADIDAAEVLTGRARARCLLRHAPPGPARLLLRHDALALALLFNLPGNALLGGGGGIALIAGLSRVYSVPRFVAVTALAVAPVPLAVWLFGTIPFAAP